jgi:cellulose synthase (UDP-forming)
MRNVSISGFSFECAEQGHAVPQIGDEIEISVRDYSDWHHTLHAKVVRTSQQKDRLEFGCQFDKNPQSDAQVVSFLYGDSERWDRLWKRREQTHNVPKLLLTLTFNGIKAFYTHIGVVLKNLFSTTAQLARQWASPQKGLQVCLAWGLYFIYLLSSKIRSSGEMRSSRVFPRISRKNHVEVYFPRLDASLSAIQKDISLSGAGLEMDLPFEILQPAEPIILTLPHPKSGEKIKLDAILHRQLHADRQHHFVAEFVVDHLAFQPLVRSVYGNPQRMLLSLGWRDLKEFVLSLFFTSAIVQRFMKNK